MVAICFYFEVHQPYRLRHYNILEVGENKNYFDDRKNDEVMKKVAHKCYNPMNKLLLKLIKKFKNKDKQFKVCFSITGTAIEQFEKYSPEVLKSFKELAKTGCVEFISETYYHSLSYLFSKEEFKQQVLMHKTLIKKHFGVEPTVFRNTELIFKNEIGKTIEDMGYKAIITEGADHIMGWKSPNFVYTPVSCKKIKLLLKNYKLSDDIAFRFSNKGWKDWPLTTDKFCKWVHSVNGNGEVINLFMDYETFGEHQWEDTGIFNFMEHLPGEFLKHPDAKFLTCSEVADSFDSVGELDIHHPISWADMERDLSAWLGNNIQDNSIAELYKVEKTIKEVAKLFPKSTILKDWRKLTTSDHFYYMCTKWFNDGDVHKYFSPYESPYDAFIALMNVLQDLLLRAQTLTKKHEEKIILSTKKQTNKKITQIKSITKKRTTKKKSTKKVEKSKVEKKIDKELKVIEKIKAETNKKIAKALEE